MLLGRERLMGGFCLGSFYPHFCFTCYLDFAARVSVPVPSLRFLTGTSSTSMAVSPDCKRALVLKGNIVTTSIFNHNKIQQIRWGGGMGERVRVFFCVR